MSEPLLEPLLERLPTLHAEANNLQLRSRLLRDYAAEACARADQVRAKSRRARQARSLRHDASKAS